MLLPEGDCVTAVSEKYLASLISRLGVVLPSSPSSEAPPPPPKGLSLYYFNFKLKHELEIRFSVFIDL
jgi:hypothetical protein